jgi:class 3 adenylate cyclase
VAGSQRRHVAILFADISGFTRLVDSTSPESVYEVIRPLMDELVLRLHRHAGEIQQILGDGFMAVFGLRQERGDEAGRALRAALDLVAVAAENTGYPQVHVGIECGEVLVTPSWEPAGYAVWGRAVNVAARLCDLAGPGDIQIGPAAFDRVDHDDRAALPARPMTAHLKGIRGTVLTHRLAGARVETPALAS